MKFINVILGFGVEVEKLTFVTHKALIDKPDFIKDVQKLVEKHFTSQELWELKKEIKKSDS